MRQGLGEGRRPLLRTIPDHLVPISSMSWKQISPTQGLHLALALACPSQFVQVEASKNPTICSWTGLSQNWQKAQSLGQYQALDTLVLDVNDLGTRPLLPALHLQTQLRRGQVERFFTSCSSEENHRREPGPTVPSSTCSAHDS